jgi:RecB family endonuclease NucS
MAVGHNGALMRLVVATCTVDYTGRLSAHLPLATRLLMVKADGSVSVHSEGNAYKPLSWVPIRVLNR